MALALPTDEIHLWQVATDRALSSDQESRLLDLLTAAERARHARFHFARDRRQYLWVHALLRLALSCYIPRPPESWVFVTNAYGKPALSGDGPRFNLSHAEGLVVCALADEVELGVDVERQDRRGDWEALARRWLAAEEQDELEKLPVTERSMAFLRLWTLKEAYAKAVGLGLSLPLDEFAVRVESEGGAVLLRQGRTMTGDWQLEQWRLDEHWLALVASLPSGKARRTVVRRDGGPLLGIS
ncbi:MAG: 4-phosphopantetheinyl transferase [Pseudomonadota bacterium]|nr:4-phosphopantetheinyl transferase [Pseudomonadota bacterium]